MLFDPQLFQIQYPLNPCNLYPTAELLSANKIKNKENEYNSSIVNVFKCRVPYYELLKCGQTQVIIFNNILAMQSEIKPVKLQISL